MQQKLINCILSKTKKIFAPFTPRLVKHKSVNHKGYFMIHHDPTMSLTPIGWFLMMSLMSWISEDKFQMAFESKLIIFLHFLDKQCVQQKWLELGQDPVDLKSTATAVAVTKKFFLPLYGTTAVVLGATAIAVVVQR